MTGTIQVEDVVLDADKSSGNKVGNQNCFRRLVFRRNPNLIQSDASLVLVKGPSKDKDRPSTVREAGRRHGSGKKKGKAKDSSNSIKQGGLWAYVISNWFPLHFCGFMCQCPASLRTCIQVHSCICVWHKWSLCTSFVRAVTLPFKCCCGDFSAIS